MKHFETQIRDFSQQFTDQVKCLDAKVALDNSILGNILDLYKRRAIIEQDYADSLLRLYNAIHQRCNADNEKRSKWKDYSPVTILNNLLASTAYTAKAHKNMADIYGKQITQRLLDMQEDCTRLNKKTTDILQKHHTEILRLLNQVLFQQKIYIKTFNEADEARKRACRAMDQLDREVIRCQDKKKELEKNQRIKKLKDEYIERYNFFKNKQADSTTARNKYIIHLLSLKETIDYFYSNELKTIVECAEYGFHNNLTRLSMNHTSCEQALITVHDTINKLFTEKIDKIDANNDTRVFLEAHKSILTLKENLHFVPAKDDNINKISKSHETVQNGLQNMYLHFSEEMKTITKKVDEDKISIDCLSRSLNDLISQNDYDVVDYICYQTQSDTASIKEKSTSLPRNGAMDTLYTSIQKLVKDNKIQTESKYFHAMEGYLSNEMTKINMASKLRNVENVLSNDTDDDESQLYRCGSTNIQSITAVIIGIKSKLFGGDLSKYSRDTHEMVPVVVQSCIRLINLHGMRCMGVFRVPGSQTDVNSYKSQFELGNDPLKELKGTSNDVNLAASILKLYFRELVPPIFDQVMFDKIVQNYSAVKRNEESVVSFMKELILTLDTPVYATLHYLISFISHLAEFSSDNCMDILNLAIIFGPCLMPIPEDKNSQLFQYQSIVNHVAQCLITHHENIFTKKSQGPIYQRDQHLTASSESGRKATQSLTEADKTKFFENSVASNSEEELRNLKRNESTRYIRSVDVNDSLQMRRNSDSEKHFDILAIAIIDYEAKNDQELSFSNGDTFFLKKRINENWWSGHVINLPERNIPIRTGLIPSAFINIFSQNEMSPDSDQLNTELLKQADLDLSSPESQRLSGKCSHSHKRSMVSIDSDNELDFSPDDNRSFSHSLENTADLSEFGDSKGFGSFENIIGEDDEQLIVGNDNEEDSDKKDHTNNESENKTNDNDEENTSNNVRIRESRSSITIFPDTTDSPDTLDDDLKQTMQGLKRIEELNVIKHRNTVHIDRSVLNSKFISPLSSDHMTIFDMKSMLPINDPKSLTCQKSMPSISEFILKKPVNCSSFTSLDMSPLQRFSQVKEIDHSSSLNRVRKPRFEEHHNLPPPLFPKPKTVKK